VLLDTNILVRTLQPHHPLYPVADRAVRRLAQRGETLEIVPQNLVELWAVATRPVTANGLGLSPTQAAGEIVRLKGLFNLFAETPALHPAWEALVVRHHVSGKQAHDARLVAAMQVHGIGSILTFNTSDFTRYSDIQVVDPAQV
jgi:predicted nucleic acid-binding protein